MKILLLHKHWLLNLLIFQSIGMNSRITMVNGTVKPDVDPGLSEWVWEALRTTDENVDAYHSVKTQLRAALNALLGVLSLSLPLNASQI
jgi:hypothetical protein